MMNAASEPAQGRSPVLVFLAALAAVAAAAFPLITLAANRLVSGKPVALSVLPAAPLAVVCVAALALLAGIVMAHSRRGFIAVALCAALFTFALVWLVGDSATSLADPAASARRISPGGAFWIGFVAGWLMLGEALQRAGLGGPRRILFAAAAALPLAALLATGRLDDLSIMKEFANRRDVFFAAFGRHCEIVGLTLLFAIAIGMPLGILAYRWRRGRTGLFSLLNLVQTIPSIALFALLLGPLSAAAAQMPVLASLGISGIGLAPAVIALTLYSLLPIARNTEAGLAEVPRGAIESARGMGFRKVQIFWQVEVPLALPLFLSGLRVTLVQAIGLSAVAALIGAGGLGSIMFQGLSGSAIDLVLLGVLPIVALAIAADAGMKLLAAAWAIHK